MKKKVLLFIIMITALFLGIKNVSAKEYQIGDMVELINPHGGKSIVFYVTTDNGNGYYLSSYDPIALNKTVTEMDGYSNEELEYIYELDDSITNNSLSFYQEDSPDLGVELFNRIYNTNNDDELEENFYFNYDLYGDKLYNSFLSTWTNSGSGKRIFQYIDRSDNPSYKYVLRTLKLQPGDDEILNSKKLNFFLTIFVSYNNTDILKKVESIDKNNDVITIDNNQPNLNKEKTSNVKNPKTTDLNVFYIILGILIFTGVIVVSSNRIKKLNKVSR